VSLRVYDVSGRVVQVLVNSTVTLAGEHAAHWDGTNTKGEPVAGGVYFYRLEAGAFSATRSTVFLR
jgi:flagellar hook assembly protein FlgD